ncbi:MULTISPECIES: LacI family DNA-binding transcriptional regulator [unclassified Arthrobacter]|uniref:LacI family DNA-binding transcriptional regulator n=1 Tax=unclassified Arthrobacter TaxID=235627 RepID=UPI00159D6475|nr:MULTISPECIES: LacI family DNA-binding transcriptional regulator [unclassified Arthrobacter]MCQ9165730.1 LacI family transcriptional regulator [Arthrobacter sp. STN4]NVN00374.1 LacI family transcriptional regulator [Arthrobacter sp. SDTb3-6]
MTAAPRPTMADVAAAAGVSRALVSIVIRGAAGASESTRARVLDVARDLGYRPDTRARLLRSSRTRLLGVVFNVTEPFHAELVELLYVAGGARGYAVTLSATGPRRSEQKAMESLLDLGVEAAIVISPATPAARLAGTPVPVVAMLDAPGGPRAGVVSSVHTDEAAGIRLAIRHLRGLGHRHIAHLDGGEAVGSAARRLAYAQAMAAEGVPPLIFHGGPLESDGSRAARELLAAMGARAGTGHDTREGTAKGRAAGAPTAVVVFNDRSALGALDTFRTAGLDVPGGLSVVGYDNSRMARLEHINLTSIGQDGQALAEAAVAAAVDRIAGGPVREAVVSPWLEPGGTTAAPTPPGS